MTPQKESPAVLAGTVGGQQEKTYDAFNISAVFFQGNAIALPETPQPLPWKSNFLIGPDGIYIMQEDEEEKPVMKWAFSPVIPLALVRDFDEQNWGLLLAVQTPSKKWHRWAMPLSLLSGNGNIYREILFDFGVRISPFAQRELNAYLLSAQPKEIARCVTKIGWHNGVYVLSDANYGSSDEFLFLQTPMPTNVFQVRGTLSEWQENIGRLCVGNSRLAFVACTAFAAVLLEPCGGLEGGGVHLLGDSSAGKTTLLISAASVAGGGPQGFIKRWRLTDNALENLALSHNDMLLCLDEIGQVSSKKIGEIAYMVANGSGKARAKKDGSGRPIVEWRTLFLSSGELSLAEKIQEGNSRHMAGQAVRILDLPVVPPGARGAFETHHEFNGGKEFADHLQKASKNYFGTPLRVFLSEFTKSIAENQQAALHLIADFEEQVRLPNYDGQVLRVIKRFALFSAAGELAIKFGIFPWPTGTALWAAKSCFQDWLAHRGGAGASEIREAARLVRAFISAHSTSRFERWDSRGSVVHNCAGYCQKLRGETFYLFHQEVFENEVCKGYDSKSVARHLKNAGFLETNLNSYTKTHTRYGQGTSARYYTVRESILAYEDHLEW